jgi:hypothetical protein
MHASPASLLRLSPPRRRMNRGEKCSCVTGTPASAAAVPAGVFKFWLPALLEHQMQTFLPAHQTPVSALPRKRINSGCKYESDLKHFKKICCGYI